MNDNLQRHMDNFPNVGMPGFVARFGRWWTAPEENERPVLAIPKHCFANAQIFLIETQSNTTNPLTYVEGYAGGPDVGFIPIHHAWLVDTRGRVIDPTWKNSHECAYFGVPLESSFVLKLVGDIRSVGHDILTYPHLKISAGRNSHLWEEAVADLDTWSPTAANMIAPIKP